MDLPVPATELTTDPFEIEILNDEELSLIEPDDPYHKESIRLTSQIAAIKSRTSLKRLNIVDALLRGKSKTTIIEEQKTSWGTIAKTIEHDDIKQYVFATLRLIHLRRGPTMNARAAMLWRIALREEEDAPSVSIKAIDTLNRQEGVYVKDEGATGGGLVINIQEFVVGSDPTPPQSTAALPAQRSSPDVVEGEFTPVTVELPD